jgi:AraC-like DNA-binding protein
MDIPKIINDWLAKIQYSFFNYKDGFFHLKSYANSPQMMLESFDKMPFVKHDRKNCVISCATPIINTRINYCEIQSGLWLLVSEMENKQNFLFHNQFKDTNEHDYFILNLHFNNIGATAKAQLINSFRLPNNGWSLVKPKANKNASHFKNTLTKNISLFISRELMELGSESLVFIQNGTMDPFLKSDNQYLICQDEISRDYLFDEFMEIMILKNPKDKVAKLKEKLNEFSDIFMDNYENEKLSDKYFRINDCDRKNIVEVERILGESIYTGFPGIDFLAESVGISPTKLKNDFKMVHESSIFKYFRAAQMNLAYPIIEKKSLSIKHLAGMFGYENSSKFANAFREHFGVLPSELLK